MQIKLQLRPSCHLTSVDEAGQDRAAIIWGGEKPGRRRAAWLYTRIVVMLLFLSAAPVIWGSEAGAMFRKGKDMEVRQDYEAAYTYYAQAYQLDPKNLEYRLSAVRIRALAGLQHVHRGQQLREQGKLEEALKEFRLCADIDPGNYIAEQEVRRTEIMIAAVTAKESNAGSVKSMESSDGADNVLAPVVLASLNDAPITIRMIDETRLLFTTLCKLAGLNVIFDPDLKDERVNIDVTDVSLTDALKLLCIESKTFWRPVTANTIFVAANSPAKRKELDQSAVRTFYLSNLTDTADLQEVVGTLRTELEIGKISPLLSQGAIVVRGTPDQIALAGKLIQDMDKSRPEVVVEVEIMQVTREKLHDLGIQPPSSFAASLVGTGAASSGSGTSSSGSSTNSGSGQLTLNDFSHLNATNFAITVPGASGQALFSDSSSRLLQNPQIRALDGRKATLKIGERVPVATGSFAGIGGGSVSALVNTQFQYLDVGLTVDVTPKVYANNDVSMKVSIDVSSVDSTTNIGGITQPVIGQHKIEQEIRLKEGEVNVIGGMLDDTSSRSMSGLPVLSSIPILKYLFGSEHVDKKQDEIVFVLVPRIVRGLEVTSANVKMIDVGTADGIELRRPYIPASSQSGKPSAESATPHLSNPSTSVKAASSLIAPRDAIASNSSASPVLIHFTQPPTSAIEGGIFTVDIVIDGAANLFSAPMVVQYDAAKLQLMDASNGDLLSRDRQSVTLARKDDVSGGKTWLSAARPAGAIGVFGTGSVYRLTFAAKTEGKATIEVAQSSLKDSTGQDVAAKGIRCFIDVKKKPG